MFRPLFAPPQIKFTISYEPMTIAGIEDTRPFVLCCHGDEFYDLEKNASAFEKMGDDSYRLILTSNASTTEIAAFEKIINESLKCAADILQHLVRYQTGLPGLRRN